MHTRTIRREMTPLFKAGDGSPGSTTSADTVKTTETRAHSGEAEYSPTAYDDAFRQYLEQRVQEGSISEFTNRAIWENTVHVMELLSKKYKTIRKELRPVMVGRVLDYEAKRIRDKGILIGEQRGELRGIQKGRILEYIDVCKTELQLHDEEILTKVMERFQLDEMEAREYFRQATMS